MAEHVGLFEAEVRAERFDVLDEPVDLVRGRVLRGGGVAGAPQVEQHQLAHPGQTAEVAEVAGRPHGATGQADQRFTLAHQVVGEFGSVVRAEDRHTVIQTGRAVRRGCVRPERIR